MTLAEALRDALRIIRLRGNAGNQEFERQANDCVKDARAALAEHEAQQQDGPCKAGGPCRFRGYASPELVEAHTAAQQQEPAHTEHGKHWDRTCPACNQTINYDDAQQQEPDAKDAEQQLSEQVQVLDAKCAEYEADAARYRWLRDVNDLTLRSTVGSKWTRLDGTVFFSRHYLACNGRQCESEDSLDKAIDAAMKEPTP
jgi:hypothetical protein